MLNVHLSLTPLQRWKTISQHFNKSRCSDSQLSLFFSFKCDLRSQLLGVPGAERRGMLASLYSQHSSWVPLLQAR